MLNQRTITLVPLSPKQVYKDQVRLQKDSEKNKTSEKQKIKKKSRKMKEKTRGQIRPLREK